MKELDMKEIIFQILLITAGLIYLSIWGYILWIVFLKGPVNKAIDSIMGVHGPPGPQGLMGEPGPKGLAGKTMSKIRIKKIIEEIFTNDPEIRQFVLELYQAEILKKLMDERLEKMRIMMMVDIKSYAKSVIDAKTKINR